jgi:hypothetical protein
MCRELYFPKKKPGQIGLRARNNRANMASPQVTIGIFGLLSKI